MTREDIQQILPHRPPMLLIDEAELKDGISICRYTVRGDEFFLQGHFPGRPVVPGVILCEMMAQASCLLVEEPSSSSTQFIPYFTGMDKVRFKKSVLPKDLLILKSELTRKKSNFYFVKCAGYVNDALCCSAEISFAIVEEEK